MTKPPLSQDVLEALPPSAVHLFTLIENLEERVAELETSTDNDIEVHLNLVRKVNERDTYYRLLEGRVEDLEESLIEHVPPEPRGPHD